MVPLGWFVYCLFSTVCTFIQTHTSIAPFFNESIKWMKITNTQYKRHLYWIDDTVKQFGIAIISHLVCSPILMKIVINHSQFRLKSCKTQNHFYRCQVNSLTLLFSFFFSLYSGGQNKSKHKTKRKIRAIFCLCRNQFDVRFSTIFIWFTVNGFWEFGEFFFFILGFYSWWTAAQFNTTRRTCW